MTIIDDVRRIAHRCDELQRLVEENKSRLDRQEEQLNGERGISAAINALGTEVRGLRRSMYWVAGLIVAASISFGFSVLTIFGG